MSTSSANDAARFNVAELVAFEAGPGGLTRASIVTKHGTGSMYLHGAHVAAWQPKGHEPVLFMSKESLFDPKKPIRGGVPVIFPWFGALASDSKAPAHGFARTTAWTVESTRAEIDGSATIVLTLASNEQTKKLWNHDFSARFTANFGAVLKMAIEVRNTGSTPFKFEEALHTYFVVGDVREVGVTGLDGVQYIDKVDGFQKKAQGPEAIRIKRETDRVYLNTKGTCAIEDPKLGRKIVVEKTGSDATVVWNPWVEKAKAMADFGDEEWPGMICVETANASDNAVNLAPGAKHEMTATIRVEKR